jgi:PAS domain S-box-containing protein
MTIWTLLHYVCFVLYFFLAAYILYKNPKSLMNVVCAILIGFFAAWSLAWVALHSPTTTLAGAEMWIEFSAPFWVSFPSMALWFGLLFARRDRVMKSRYFFAAILAVPLILTAAIWLNLWRVEHFSKSYGWVQKFPHSIWSYVYFLYLFIFIGLTLYSVHNFGRKSRDWRIRRQSLVIFYTGVAASLAGTYSNILNPGWGWLEIPNIANILFIIWAVGLMIAVVRYRMFIITPATAAENILAAMTDSFILLDSRARVMDVNQTVLNKLKYQREDLTGKSLQNIFKTCDDAYQTFFEDGVRICANCEGVLLSRDGGKIPVMAATSPLKKDKGEIVGFVFIARDISEKKRMEELSIEKEMADAASLAKSEFLANMSHELRTPLNAIIGFSQVLGDMHFGELNPSQKEYVTDILESGHHLLNLVNDILDLSKIEVGKVELQLTDIDIAELLQHSLVMVREKCRKHRIDLRLDVPHNRDDLDITGDPRRLKQVLFNLLSNAAKFTPDGGHIVVKAERNESKIELSITDSGIGIEREHHQKIFEPFYQVLGANLSFTQGVGLGLNLTKQIVELHGGRIWVESEGKDRGSTFRLILPVSPPGRPSRAEKSEEKIHVRQDSTGDRRQ